MVTLASQAQSDLDDFVMTTEEFAVSVTYTPVGEPGSAVNAIVDSMPAGREFGNAASEKTAGVLPAKFIVSLTDVATPVPRDTITHDGLDYIVDRVEADVAHSALEATAVDPDRCDKSVTIEKATHTADNYGTQAVSWGAAMSALKCNFQAINTDTLDLGGREVLEVSHRMWVPYVQPLAQAPNPPSDLIDFFQNDADQSELRMTFVDATRTRYFEIRSAYDLAEQKRMIVCDLVEREETWFKG